MKLGQSLAFLLALAISQWSHADNIIRMNAPITQTTGTWVQIADQVSVWSDVGAVYGCTNWSPATSTVDTDVAFTQTATNCQQSQQRTVQAQEQNQQTHAIRKIGTPTIEQGAYSVTQTQNAIGTSGTWVAAGATKTAWGNVGAPVNCTNWSPDASTIASGVSFTQTATNCQQSQEQTSQPREQNSVSLAYRNAGAAQTLSQVEPATMTRTAIGAKTSVSLTYYTKVGYQSGFYGTVPVWGIGAVITNESAYPLTRLWLQTGSPAMVIFQPTGIVNEALIQSAKLEMFDSAGNLIHTVSSSTSSPVKLVLGVGFGYNAVASDYTKAATAMYYRLTVVLN